MTSITKKLFSPEGLQNIFSTFLKAHARFPFTLFMSFSASAWLIYAITEEINDLQIHKLITTLVLGLPLFLGIELYNERSRINRIIPILVALGFLVYFYFFSKPIGGSEIFAKPAFRIEFFATFIAFHLFVSVSPYIFQKNITSFWHYNKTLFIAILTAFLYSVTLSVGLMLAIEGIKNLFEVKISNDVYPYILVGINGYFNTIFFVSRIPSLKEIDEDTFYPIGLKYFTQYVLLPLVAIYLMILLAYEGKIALQWDLPKGWVSLMVLASAVFGILAFLLLFPLQKISRWVQQFTRIYYWILLPLVALMMVAIYVRFTQYGLTEPRYIVAMLSVWLLGISLYFVISKEDNIKIVPLSLFLIVLLGIYGPFNAFYSSKKNQEKRLNRVLSANNLLKNGKISVPPKFSFTSPTESDAFFAAVEYLAINQENTLKSLLTDKQFEQLKKANEYDKVARFCELTTLTKPTNFIGISHYFSAKYTGYEALEKADYLVKFGNAEKQEISLTSATKVTISNSKNEKFPVNIGEEEVIFDLKSLLSLSGSEVPIENLTFRQETAHWKLRLVIENGNSNEGKIDYVNGNLFLTKK